MMEIPIEQLELPWEERDPKYFLGLKCDIEPARILINSSGTGDVDYWNKSYGITSKNKVVYLQGINLNGLNLDHVRFSYSHLEYADFQDTKLNNSVFCNVFLDCASFNDAYLSESSFNDSSLVYTSFRSAHLAESCFFRNIFKDNSFYSASLEGAYFSKAKLNNLIFQNVYLNERTDFRKCHIDKYTDFRGASIGSLHISPVTRSLLRYNMRRLAWEDWYKDAGWNPFKILMRQFVHLFWWSSDYGRSAKRVIISFIYLSCVFTLIYFFSAMYAISLGDGNYMNHPGIVDGLILEEHFTNGEALLRSLYFSIVTMTTLGFGDIKADPHSWLGHIVLCLHVLTGYVLLGSLIAVFGTYISSEAGPVYFPEEKRKPLPITDFPPFYGIKQRIQRYRNRRKES